MRLTLPVVVVTCPKLAIYSYEGEYNFEQRLQGYRFWPDERIPSSAFEMLLLSAFQVKPEDADKPVRSPDQKEAAG